MIKVFFLLLLPILAFSRVHVTVHFPLEAFFIKKIGQKSVRIKTIINNYQEKIIDFRKSEYKRFSQADIYFYFDLQTGRKYAETLKEYNPNLIISNLSKNINKLKHNNKENPYIWMDPIKVREVAQNIYKELSLIDKRHESMYKKNYEEFLNELDELFLKTKKRLFDSENYNFFVYDEYWQYYAKRFRLNLYYKEKRYLKAHEIKDLNSMVEKYDIKSILISKNDTLSIVQSISGNSNIRIKTHNIFEPVWFYNISKLTSTLIK